MSEALPETASLRTSVLLVEDDDSVRRSLQLLLRSRGFDVRAYASARQALTDPDARSAQCLIADLVMPEMDGFALLHALRGQGWREPAILISGFLTEGWEGKAREAGFDAVLPKPIVDGQLLEAVIKRTGAGANACPPATP